MAAVVQGRNLTKSYELGDERVYALNDVSLAIHPGEMVAIQGRPASGKSTLLHMLAGFITPDSGQVHMGDEDVTQYTDEEMTRVRASTVGFLFQAFNLLPNETVLKNVEIWSRGKAEERRQRAWESLRAVGLERGVDHSPGQLSGRQRQFVAVARALVNNPPVILADEPTRGLDSTSRVELMGLFQKLNDEGTAIVIATPEASIARYCRRVVRIAGGSIVGDELVSERHIVPSTRIPEGPADRSSKEEEAVCPRCNYGNARDLETCQQCQFPLHLTQEEERSLQSRLSPNPPKDTDGRREGSGRGWVRELQGRWPGVLG